MKRKKIFFATITLLLSSFLLAGCGKKQEETSETSYEYYKNGTFAPGYNTYILKLPSEKWEINGEENQDNITFVLNNNKIALKKYQVSDKEFENRISEIPTTQLELEEHLKENNIKDYYINTFINKIYYDEEYNLLTTQYIYTDSDGTFHLYNSVLNENYLYEISGIATNEETLEDVEICLNNFILLEHNKEINVFKLKEKQVNGNIYNSKNNDFSLALSYANWDFQVPENYASNPTTTISTDGMTITIQKHSINNSSNTLVYEIPKTIEILKKQIDMKNFGQYSVLDYKVKTIGTLPDYDEEQDFTTFSYLIKCNENEDMKYYAYKEYRTGNSIYQLIGVLTIDEHVKAIELNQILNSFYPTSEY